MELGKSEKLKIIKPLISKNDVSKIIEMNRQIIETNCAILKILNTPCWIVKNEHNLIQK